MLCTLISKVPMSVGDRWNRRVQSTRKNQLRKPDLADFIKFVDEETELVNDPLYSQEAVDQHTERKARKIRSFGKRDRRFKTLAIQLEEGSKEKSRTKDTKDVVRPQFVNTLFMVILRPNMSMHRAVIIIF